MFARADAVWMVPYQQGVVLFSGTGTPLRPQDALCLAKLVANRGLIVSNDDLIAAIWGDKTPDDPIDLLKHIIWRLRKALPKNLVWIEHAMSGKGGPSRQIGYRLMGSIGFKEVAE